MSTLAASARYCTPLVSRSVEAPAPSSLPFHLGAGLLILTLTVFRVWFLLTETTLSLSTDEAHYWDWSRHLDWCYYSKGPLVAWLIRASGWLYGADTMVAVRFPAVLCAAMTMAGAYVLVYRIFRDPKFALLALLAAQTLPFLHVGGLLMTIDAPYCCAWTWAAVVAHILLGWRPSGPRVLWLLLGLLVAVGVLAKHNMALFVPSVGLFLVLSKSHRGELLRPGFWLMALTGAVLGGGPILGWNSQHDWITFRHVGTQAGIETAVQGVRWLGPLEFLAMQGGILLGLWFVLMLIGFVRVGLDWWKGMANEDQLYLTCLAVPMLLICLAFSFKVRIEPNWPVTAYITGLIVAAGAFRARAHLVRWRRTALGVSALGLLFSCLIYRTEILYPLHLMLAPDVSPRKWDPTCRLKGFPALATAVETLRRKEARPPMLLGSNWSYTGVLAFHLPDQPTVYCLGPVAGSRHSQYDLWRPNPLYDPNEFTGRDAIIVGDITPQVRAAFERLEPVQTVRAEGEDGLVVAEWRVTVARGFRPGGFGDIGVNRH